MNCVGEISAACQAQSAGNQTTQQNAALVEESAAAAENLKSQIRLKSRNGRPLRSFLAD